MNNVAKPRVFAYVVTTVGRDYKLRGSVPWVVEGKVFFGPCKKKMRPEMKPGDYVMGISPAGVGSHRRVLLWMHIAAAMTFAQAYQRGKDDKLFRFARGNAIHVRPKRGSGEPRGDPGKYEHIPHAPHSSDWRTDIKGKRDVIFVGDSHSWAAEKGGPRVTEELVALLRVGIKWKGKPTIHNPLTENARGKHVLLIGKGANQVIQWVSEPSNRVLNSGSRTSCHRHCSCE